VAKKKRTTAAKADPMSATLAVNRRARFDYEILQRYDAGIVLLGTEIRSLREGKANIGEGYARIVDDELWLYNVHIAAYQPARENHDPTRARKLLLHRNELDRIRETLEQQPRTTLVPLRLYLARGRAKVELGLGMGRRAYDKRQAIAKRESDRTIARAMRQAQR
jgi:SsrA-binding protein